MDTARLPHSMPSDAADAADLLPPAWLLRSEGFAEDLPETDEASFVNAPAAGENERSERRTQGWPGMTLVIAVLLVAAGAAPVWALAAGF